MIGSLHRPDEFESAPETGRSAATAPRSSPRARRKARELGIEWSTVAGTGRSGRIRERDVLAAAAGPATHTGSAADSVSGSEFQVVPIDATCRAIAERVMQTAALDRTGHLYDHRIVDGAPAARFLQTLGGLLENPSAWLMP